MTKTIVAMAAACAMFGCSRLNPLYEVTEDEIGSSSSSGGVDESTSSGADPDPGSSGHGSPSGEGGGSEGGTTTGTEGSSGEEASSSSGDDPSPYGECYDATGTKLCQSCVADTTQGLSACAPDCGAGCPDGGVCLSDVADQGVGPVCALPCDAGCPGGVCGDTGLTQGGEPIMACMWA